MRMQVLVLGGAGFIGRNLVRRLSEESSWDITVVDDFSGVRDCPEELGELGRHARVVRCDYGEVSTYREDLERAEIIVNLIARTGAAESQYRAIDYFETNVRKYCRLLDELRGRGHAERLVQVSSARVMGEGQYICEVHGQFDASPRPGEQFRRLGDEVYCPTCKSEAVYVLNRIGLRENPSTVYGLTKLCQEVLTRQFAAQTGCSYAVLRLENVYGRSQNLANAYTGVLGAFLAGLVRRGRCVVFERGRIYRDFVEVSDVVSAILEAMHLEENVETFVGTGRMIALRDVAEMLARIVGGVVEPRAIHRIGDVKRSATDGGAMWGRSGTRVRLEQGLELWATWAVGALKDRDDERALRELTAAGLLVEYGE